jgi:hypothetical protein
MESIKEFKVHHHLFGISSIFYDRDKAVHYAGLDADHHLTEKSVNGGYIVHETQQIAGLNYDFEGLVNIGTIRTHIGRTRERTYYTVEENIAEVEIIFERAAEQAEHNEGSHYAAKWR